MDVLRSTICPRMARSLLAVEAGTPGPTNFPKLGSLHQRDRHQVIPSTPVLVETTPISPLSPFLDAELGREIRQSPKLSTTKLSPQQTL